VGLDEELGTNRKEDQEWWKSEGQASGVRTQVGDRLGTKRS